MFTRPVIDSLDFARKGMETSGEVPMAELPRMADLLTDLEGKISYVLRGLMGRDGKPLLQLELDGTCNLRCQRCLEAMDFPLHIEERLMLRSQDELDALQEDDEEYTCAFHAGRAAVY